MQEVFLSSYTFPKLLSHPINFNTHCTVSTGDGEKKKKKKKNLLQ